MELILVLGCIALVVVVGRYAPVTGFVAMFSLYAWSYVPKAWLANNASAMQIAAVLVGLTASVALVAVVISIDFSRNMKGYYKLDK